MSASEYIGPLDIDVRLESAISAAVKEFGTKASLEFEVRYHDEPIWYVRKADANHPDFFRQVQVAVFRLPGSEDEPELFAIPFAYILTPLMPTKLTVSESSPIRRQIEQPRLTRPGAIHPRRIKFVDLPPYQVEIKLKAELALAWGDAKKLKRSQIARRSLSR
jgi:hypothetical protein